MGKAGAGQQKAVVPRRSSRQGGKVPGGRRVGGRCRGVVAPQPRQAGKGWGAPQQRRNELVQPYGNSAAHRSGETRVRGVRARVVVAGRWGRWWRTNGESCAGCLTGVGHASSTTEHEMPEPISRSNTTNRMAQAAGMQRWWVARQRVRRRSPRGVTNHVIHGRTG